MRSCVSEDPTAEEFLDESVEEDLPGVDLSHLSPSEREQIRAVMRMAQMDDPGRREGRLLCLLYWLSVHSL